MDESGLPARVARHHPYVDEPTAGAEFGRLPCSSLALAPTAGACKGRFAAVNRDSCMRALGRQRTVGPRRSSRSIGPGRCLAPVLAHQPPAASTVIGYVSSALGTGHWRRSHLRA